MLAENFSERNLLKAMATEQKCDIWTVRQEFAYDPSVTYLKHRVPIGIDEYGRTVNINLNESNHICVLGGTGSGKTFLTRGMFNRFKNAGGAVAVVTDIKRDIVNSCVRRNQAAIRFSSTPLTKFTPLITSAKRSG